MLVACLNMPLTIKELSEVAEVTEITLANTVSSLSGRTDSEFEPEDSGVQMRRFTHIGSGHHDKDPPRRVAITQQVKNASD